MTPDRHAAIRAIFLEVISSPEAQRSSLLAERCQDDKELRVEVEQLISNHTAEPPAAASSSPTVPSVAAPPASVEPPPPVELVAGEVIAGRYRIHGRLGEGATGVVYRADDMVLKQPVAMKFLRTKGEKDSRVLERFRREVRMALRVSHPNVCRVFDIGESNGRSYFTMEFCGGEDLSHLIRRAGRISVEKGTDIARQICSGLAAAHSAGILHRDLKPGNVLLDSKGRVLITDFGIAAAVDAAGFRELAGTPGYMAPEQIIGVGVDERSDIYSLGLVMYELFSGKPAFGGKTIKDSLAAQLDGDPPELSEVVPGVDPDIESLVGKCISRERDNRPSSALVVAAALPGVDALAVAIEAAQTAPPSLVGDSANLARKIRRPLVWGAVALVGCLLLPMVRAWSHFPWDDPSSKPPSVLLDRARSLCRAVYGAEAYPHFAFGYCDQLRAQRVLEQVIGDFPSDRALGRSPGLIFWYREARTPLTPITVETLIFGPGNTTSVDPPHLNTPQHVMLLDSGGRLLATTDTLFGSNDNAMNPLDDSRLRETADIKGTSSDLVALKWSNPAFGSFCNATGVRLVDEKPATLLACAPREFTRVFAVLEEPQEMAGGLFSVPAPIRGRIAIDLLRFLYVLATLLAIPFAIHNVRLSRCDLVGASRLAMLFLIANLLGWALCGSFGGTPNTTLALIAVALLRGFGIVAMVLMFYLALEPLARKHCPHLMILWTRLLQARPISPVLYDHLLVGITVGILLALVLSADFAIVHFLGRVHAEPLIAKQVGQRLPGLGSFLSGVLHSAQSAVAQGLLLLLILTSSKAVLRRKFLAASATALVLLILVTPRIADLLVSPVLVGVFGVGLITWITIRYGLVSLVVALFVFDVLNSTPMTWRPSDWFFPVSISALGVTTAIALLLFVKVRNNRCRSPLPARAV